MRRLDLAERFWAKVNKLPGDSACWEWCGAASKAIDGRQSPRGKINVDGKVVSAYCVAYELTFGSYDKKLHVCHRCDNPLCVRPEHLFLGTRVDNMQDSVKKRRNTFGERQNHAKLTWGQVAEIRRLWASGVRPQTAIAATFGVAQSQISMIVRRRTWI